jgi:hypothetical protein
MSLLIASQIVLWIAVLALGTVCIALARQIGGRFVDTPGAAGWRCGAADDARNP